MNYFHLIEPYLHGALPPEDEIAFERQLSCDPALAEEASRRLNGRPMTDADTSEHTSGERPSGEALKVADGKEVETFC